jgi:surface antigen
MPGASPRSKTDIRLRIVAAVLLAGMAGCTTIGAGTQVGSGGGDPAGGGTSGATMVGGLVSGSMAEGLGSGDIRKALQAEYRALEFSPSGQSVAWSGSFGRSGEVVPAQPYRVGSQDCRQYTHRLTVGGTTRTARGTACRNADGSWATLT